MSGEGAKAAPLLFPVSRVRRIVKADPDVGAVQNDAVFGICAAAELFVDHVTRAASRQCKADRRRTIAYRDVSVVVAEEARLAFLADLVPRAMAPAEAAERRARIQTERAALIERAGLALVADDPDADPDEDGPILSASASRAESPKLAAAEHADDMADD